MDKAEIGRLYFETIADEADKVKCYAQAGEYKQAILQTVIVLEMQNEVIRMLIGSSNVKSIHKYEG